jgi:sugar phosphate isomerase/epimerase
MRIGVDGRKIPRAKELGPLRSLDHGRELGMEGLFFRTVLEMSPTLDAGELREIRAHADELGMYLETGLGKVNPFATPEAPELRDIGDGDIRLGFERMMRACAEIGCTEVWVGTANYKSAYHGYLAYDRFRTDVAWDDQLVATERFLRVLAPIARDLGIHMNVETHEEITSPEVVRLVEAVGPDVIGITFDVANVLQRGEDPVLAARRVAPYVRQSHLKDAILWFVDDGVQRQVRPCGEGVVDWETILPLLAEHRPNLNLSIENQTAHSVITIQIFDPTWLASHPDLTKEELAGFVRLARACERRIASGEVMAPEAYAEIPFDYEFEARFIRESAAYLRRVLRRTVPAAVRREPRIFVAEPRGPTSPPGQQGQRGG